MPKNIFSTNNQVTQDYRGNQCMARVDYRYTSLHDRRGLPLEKQLAREKEEGTPLPCFLQQQHARFSLDVPTWSTLKSNNFENQPFMNPQTSLNLRSDFRKAALRAGRASPEEEEAKDEGPKYGGGFRKKKQKMTFN